MARVTVFGGTGFIGSHLTALLSTRGHQVTVFARRTVVKLVDARLDNIRYIFGDFNNANDVSRALQNTEIVFHLIGNTVPKTSNENPEYDVAANIVPSLQLFNLAKQYNINHIIFTSSGGTVYGETNDFPIAESHETFPVCSYGIQKLAIEHYMRLYHRLHNMNMTVIRLSNPYGPGQENRRGQGIIGVFCTNIMANKPLQIFGNGDVVRDFIFVADVADALERIIEKGNGYQVYNLGTQVGTNLMQLVELFRKLSGLTVTEEFLPGRNFDIPINVLNCEKIRSCLNWTPKHRLAEGLQITLDWFRKVEC